LVSRNQGSIGQADNSVEQDIDPHIEKNDREWTAADVIDETMGSDGETKDQGGLIYGELATEAN
jgi:hypothetical protein